MNEWTNGYMTDINYTFGYYAELNPLRVRLALLNAGLRFPKLTEGCELGFGQGLSLNIHAAASAMHWYGTDFNPTQAKFAQTLAEVAESKAKLYDDDFDAFANRNDLPDFDFIGIHGIWSWISDKNQNKIVKFIRRKLKVGGVLYISYNVLPGWISSSPLRYLLAEYYNIMSPQGHNTVSRIDEALDFCEKFAAISPGYFLTNPQAMDRFRQLKQQDKHYLAHEYFNRDWKPIYFRAMAEQLSSAKLDFACSAFFVDHIDVVNITKEQQTFLNDIPDLFLRESVRDFIVNQQFRRDYWIRGKSRFNVVDQVEKIREQRVVLQIPGADTFLKATTARGEVALNKEIYTPIFDFIGDYKVKTLGQIEQAVKGANINFPQVVQAVLMLIGSGQLAPAQDDTTIGKTRKHVDKLNTYLINMARGSNDIAFLASPVTGGGIVVSRVQQLFLLALRQGRKQPSELVQFVWRVLVDQGHKIIKEGKTLESDAENLDELTRQAVAFTEKVLPFLKGVQVV